VLAVALVLLFTLLISVRGLARVYTDYLLFDSLDFGSVWGTTVGARISLGLLFTALFFLLAWGNLFIADRLAPAIRPAGPEEELLAGYHEVVGPRVGTMRIVLSLLFALIAGAGVSGRWREWLLFRHGGDFGITDPQFGWDVGWYVFKLPFLTFVVRWAFAALVIVLLLTAVAHYLNGGIRFQTAGQRVTPQVKAHLSVLLGLLALLKAADYWLQRFELTTSDSGVADGAFFTDVNARLPAIQLLLLISLFAAGLLLYNIRRRGWTLPVIAVGLWAFVAVVMGGVYPAVIQQFRVNPDERAKELPFIERNIAATQAAYGLEPETTDFAYDRGERLTADEVRSNRDVFTNIRVLDPLQIANTFDRLQGERDFYRFTEPLDTDRYVLDGEQRQVVLAVRELNPSETGSWVRSHVQFTHGYGLALAPASEVSASGDPVFAAGELPLEVAEGLELEIDRPQVYFGEDLGGYAIVGAVDDEVDYTNERDESVRYRYEGDGGVEVGSLLRRAAFALRFGEIEPLISGQMTSESRVIYVRDIEQRVETVAPFLSWDADPYPVVHDGGIVYVLDGYTTTSLYPYSQQADVGDLPPGSGLRHGFNYVRHSVKAVVDSYHGTVTLYAMPVEDPLLDAWRKAFPDLFQDYDQMPAGLRDHMRYPEDLFRVQTDLWGRYRLDDPGEWFDRALEWSVAQDPGTGQGSRLQETTAADGTITAEVQRIAPVQQLLRLPGREELSYAIMRSYVPFSANDQKKELTAFISGEVTPEGTLALSQYRVDPGVVGGPALVEEQIRSVDDISRFQTEVGQRGSTVIFGEMLLVPVGDLILYVRPVFVRAENTGDVSGGGGVTQLRKVIVALGERVVFEDSLQEAIEELVGDDLEDVFGERIAGISPDEPDVVDPSAPEEPDDGSPEPSGDELEDLLLELGALKEERDAALADGDLESFGRIQAEMDAILEQVLRLVPDPSVTTTTAATEA
jgi:uncharacterized membrane protein (UPF0182 family)